MKKFLTCFSLALFVLFGGLLFTACGNSDIYVLPQISCTNQGWSIEYVDNLETSHVLPIPGMKVDHDVYANQKEVQWAWLVKHNDNVVGFIKQTTGGYDSNGKNPKFGYSPSYNNDVYTFGTLGLEIVLRGTDPAVFDQVEVTGNYPVTKQQQGLATEDNRYENGEGFIYCALMMDLDGQDPHKVKEITYSITFPSV